MNADKKFFTVVTAGLFTAALSCGAVLAQQGAAGSGAPKTTTNSSTMVEHEDVHTEGVHHYGNSAQEAQDALLITEVKTALATDGVGNGHPMEVDCDHGVARLTGVVSSAEDARHAAEVAANVPGIAGVDNKLTWK